MVILGKSTDDSQPIECCSYAAAGNVLMCPTDSLILSLIVYIMVSW